MTTSIQERNDFSKRLMATLDQASDIKATSPTQLSRAFNIRHPGAPITVHAARKWLVGEAIPTQPKMRVLADWLGVTPEWLRFGGERTEPAGRRATDVGPTHAEVEMLTQFRSLGDNTKETVRGIIKFLAHKKASGK